MWTVNTLPYNERREILSASIDMRLDACRVMVAAGKADDGELYEKGKAMHDYAVTWARKARSK